MPFIVCWVLMKIHCLPGGTTISRWSRDHDDTPDSKTQKYHEIWFQLKFQLLTLNSHRERLISSYQAKINFDKSWNTQWPPKSTPTWFYFTIYGIFFSQPFWSGFFLTFTFSYLVYGKTIETTLIDLEKIENIERKIFINVLSIPVPPYKEREMS